MIRYLLIVAAVVVSPTRFAVAGHAPLGELTHASGDVQFVGASGNERVTEGQALNGPTAVETVRQSRAEVKLRDGAVVRFGADSAAKMDKGRIEFERGLLLVQSPARGQRLVLRVQGIGAAVTGTTALVEYRPPLFKFLVLQGTGRLYRPSHWGDSVLVNAGQMVFGKTSDPLNDAVDFKLDRFVKTCRLLNELGPLPNTDILVAAANEQNKKHRGTKLIETNLVIFGEGTSVTLTQDGNAADTGSDASATPPPSANTPGTMVTAPTQTAMDARRP